MAAFRMIPSWDQPAASPGRHLHFENVWRGKAQPIGFCWGIQQFKKPPI